MLLPVFHSLTSYLERRRPFNLEDYAAEREKVCEIIAGVRRRGDAAVKEYTALYDGAVLDNLLVSEPDFYSWDRITVIEKVGNPW